MQEIQKKVDDESLPTNLSKFESSDIRKMLMSFISSQETRELISYYRKKSFWETVHKERDEVMHSQFLAWLFNPEETHNLGVFCLEKLFQMLSILIDDMKLDVPCFDMENHNHLFDKELLDRALLEQCRFEKINVTTEQPTSNGKRIDIYISGDISYQGSEGKQGECKSFKLVIENKVKAKEHDKQTNEYFSWIKENLEPTTQIICLYLTPLPSLKLRSLKKPECECQQFIQINYQYLLQYVLEPAYKATTDSRTKVLLEDYIRALSIRAISEDNSNFGDLTMAISEREKTLLRDFLNKHLDLIQAAVAACANDEEATEEEREKCRILQEKLSELSTEKTKARRKFEIRYEKDVISTNCIMKDVAVNTLCYLQRTRNLPSPKDFNKIVKVKCSNYTNYTALRKKEELKKLRSKDEDKLKRWFWDDDKTIVFDGTDYLVSTQWTIEGLNNFRETLKDIYGDKLQVIQLNN